MSQDFLIKKIGNFRKANIVITKKVAPRAVDRNRIKRIVKEALRSLNHNKREFQIIVVRNIANLKSQVIKERIERILKNEKENN